MTAAVIDLELPVTGYDEAAASRLLEGVIASRYGGEGVTRHRPNLVRAQRPRRRSGARTTGIWALLGPLVALWYVLSGAKLDLVGDFETRRTIDGLAVRTNGPHVAEQFAIVESFLERLSDEGHLTAEQRSAARAELGFTAGS